MCACACWRVPMKVAESGAPRFEVLASHSPCGNLVPIGLARARSLAGLPASTPGRRRRLLWWQPAHARDGGCLRSAGRRRRAPDCTIAVCGVGEQVLQERLPPQRSTCQRCANAQTDRSNTLRRKRVRLHVRRLAQLWAGSHRARTCAHAPCSSRHDPPTSPRPDQS